MHRYLELLAKDFPNSQAVKSELINLAIIQALPKGTEFFFSDLHGEYEAFIHLLRSASGVIKNKIDLLYPEQSNDEREMLAHLIYYPKEQIEKLNPTSQWYEEKIYQLIHLAKFVSRKYSRSKVNKKMPKQYAYVIGEMLNGHYDEDTQSYYHEMIQTVMDIHDERAFVISLCRFIRDICMDYIHIIGDIYDRGPRPDLIIEELMKYKQVDIQWGNHDIAWMGAACGNEALICNVIRIALSYNHYDLLETAYGINLRPLSDFARTHYKDDDCLAFMPHILDENKYDLVDKELTAKMHKAITIIQLKLDEQLISRHPEYHIQQAYSFGSDLTQEEQKLLVSLKASFRHSYQLHRHIQYLYDHGSMYLEKNGNLLFHGCIPMNENGSFREVEVKGKMLTGKALLDALEKIVINAYFNSNREDIDYMWYLWRGQDSPLFGKSQMTIYEKYFENRLVEEKMDPYYRLVENEDTCRMILNHFGLTNKYCHIINGHVPVKVKNGESFMKGNGLLFMIDGGISKAYQEKTGSAGYTLIYDSQHLQLAKHRPYDKEAKDGLLCLSPEVEIIETRQRVKNKDCDIGKILFKQQEALKELFSAYQTGQLKEKR